MYLGEPLDGYIQYLNSILDVVAENPCEAQYIENILDTKIKSNIEFYIYTYLYSKVNYNINKVFTDYENTLTNPFKNTYINAGDIINNVNNPSNIIILYSYNMMYDKYKLNRNFFTTNFDILFERIYRLVFTFNAQDVNLNIGEIINIILEFCEYTNTNPIIFMKIIDDVFEELILSKSDAIRSNIKITPVDNKLPIISSSFVIKEFSVYRDLLNSQVIDFDNRYIVSQVILHKAYKVKELIRRYLSDLDDNVFRSYFIIALGRFVTTFTNYNTLENNDLLCYLTLNNIINLCSRLKIHVISMFDYNYVKGII